jgi:hypothetical protein
MLHTIGNKSRMLAATVVVALIKGFTGAGGCSGYLEVIWHMAAAAQHLVGFPGFLQHLLGGLHVHRLAVMAGAQHRRVFGRKAKVLRAARLYKGQGL